MLTLNDLNTKGKTVLLRCDINCPINDESSEIIDDSKIEEITVTIKELIGSKLVIASHQGRPGKKDFISLKQHSEIISRLIGHEIKFVEDICGELAIDSIKSMKDGDITLLDNLRFDDEENNQVSIEQAIQSKLVKNLAPYIDICVLDAFSTAHRSNPSIVGFSTVIPSCAGRIVQREVDALSKIVNNSNVKFTVISGGAKIPDRLAAITKLLEAGKVYKICLGGKIGNAFLVAKNLIESKNAFSEYTLEEEENKEHYDIEYAKKAKANDETAINTARKLLEDYSDKIELPIDYGAEVDEKREDFDIAEIQENHRVFDIGPKTIEKYSKIINNSQTIFITGPLGWFENKEFAKGTMEILRNISNSTAKSITSGGHLSAAVEQLDIKHNIDHVSTAGGALITFLSGQKLPLLEALELSQNKFRGKN